MSDKPIVPLGLGDLSADALKLSSEPAFWTITTGEISIVSYSKMPSEN
jgi:hypothetical protein